MPPERLAPSAQQGGDRTSQTITTPLRNSVRSFGDARDLCAAPSAAGACDWESERVSSFRELGARAKASLVMANASQRAAPAACQGFDARRGRCRRAVQSPVPRPPWPHQLSRRHLPRRQIRETCGSRIRPRALRCGPHGRSACILDTRSARAAKRCCSGRAVLDYPSLSRRD